MSEYDAVVVGASVAGASTATLLARQGLRVALVEKASSEDHYKRLCTHELVPIGLPVLDRLGVLDELRSLGGGYHASHIWTRYGWIRPQTQEGDELPESLNVRREVLDPMLRRVAAATDGVDVMLGTTVQQVLRSSGGRPEGVQVRRRGGSHHLTARVVIGADGQHSAVAELTGTPVTHKPHGRFGYAAYFRHVPGLDSDRGPTARFWFLDPDIAYTFPTDEGLTVLAVALHSTPGRLEAFRADTDAAFRRVFDELPGAPDFSGVERAGRYIGLVSTRNSRRPAASAGLALVGDAAQVTDFVWGTGCSFALASAAWLADSVGPSLAGGGSDLEVDAALQSYSRQHRRRLGGHYHLTSSYSTGRGLSVVERTLFGGAARDPAVARAIQLMAGRTLTPAEAITPPVVFRAMVSSITGSKAARSAPGPGSRPRTPAA